MINDMKKLNVKRIYNKIIAIMCMFILGISLFLPLYAAETSTGTVFKTSVTYALSDDQILGLARVCKMENSTSINAYRAEASIMANLYECYGSGQHGNASSLVSYVRSSGWFSTRSSYSDTSISVSSEALAAVKDVLVNGNRFFPPYVIEHDDLFLDIAYIINDGVEYRDKATITNTSNYIKDKTIIRSRFADSDEYIFYCFPDDSGSCDPFGYISKNTNSDVPYTETGSTGTVLTDIDMINRVLYFGDSVTAQIENYQGIKYSMATVGDTTTACYNKINVNSKTYENKQLPDATQIDAISILLGANDGYTETAVNNIKKLIEEKIRVLYPNTPIFVQGMYTYAAEIAGGYTHNKDVVGGYNQKLKEMCEGLNNVYYVAPASELMGSDGYAKEDYVEPDGVHPDVDGTKVILDNLKAAILGQGITSSGSSSSTTTTPSPYKLTISIDEDERIFQLSYDLYDEERAEKLKEQFEKRDLEELYNKILELDQEEGIGAKDNNGRLAILASFVDNGVDVTQLAEDLILRLPDFLKAELLSTYPDIREKEDLEKEIEWEKFNIGQFQGIVRLKRKQVEHSNGDIELDGEGNPIVTENSEEFLEYIPKEEFDELIEDNDEDVLQYFTMDEECSYIIIAKTTTTDGEVTISEQNVNYKSNVASFAMNFELLEALYAVTKDDKLINEIIDLAYQGTIQIALLENLTVTDNFTKTIEEVATGEIITDGENVTYGPLGEYVQQSESTSVQRTITTTYSMKVDKVDTWVCSMEQLYKPKYTEDFGSFGDPTYGEGYLAGEDETNYYYTRTGYSYKTDTYKATWEEDGEATEHIKIKDDEGKWEGLLSVLGRQTLLTEKYVYDQSISNIYSADLWIFQMLEEAGIPTAQVNLIKYMFYEFFKVYYGTEEDYGVTEPPSFDELFSGSFNINNATGSLINADSIEATVWYTLKSYGFSDYVVAGIMGNMVGESGLDPTLVEYGFNEETGGIGLCQWTAGRNTQLKAYAASKGKEWTDLETQIEFLIAEITNPQQGPAADYAVYQFMTKSYNGVTYTNESWLNSTDVEYATMAFCIGWERPDTTHSTFPTSIQRRIAAAQEFYDMFSGTTAPNTSGNTSGNTQGTAVIPNTNATGFWWPIGKAYANSVSIEGYNTTGHFGIDIAGDPKGVIDIIASYDGEVVAAYNDITPEYDDLLAKYPNGVPQSLLNQVHGGYGNYVAIKHNYNGTTLYTYYAHMTQSVTVNEGDYVKAGTVLGKMGSSGQSTGTHLHFEIRDSSQAWRYSPDTDPLLYVQPGEYPE